MLVVIDEGLTIAQARDELKVTSGHALAAMADVNTWDDHFRAIRLLNNAHAIGHRLGDLPLKDQGVELLAICRGGNRMTETSLDTPLRKGDTLVIYGPLECLEETERQLLTGMEPSD